MTTIRAKSGALLVETEVGLFTIEASELRWPPGVWPNLFTATLQPRGIEPEMPVDFWLVERHVVAGELQYARYQSRLGGMNVVVLND